MKSRLSQFISASLAALTPFFSSPLSIAQDKDEEEIFVLSPFTVDSGGFGATPGGAQDIAYARSQVEIGNIPHPNTFTAEGLFSEHDLALASSSRCEETLYVFGEAMPAELLQRPNVVAIGQIGFGSGLDPATWQPEPLNLVAVIDKSGSMSGQPLELVKQSLLQIISQLDQDDQLSIVLYGDRSHIYMNPTRVSRHNLKQIERQIQAIASSGSTNMEHGLKVGYSLAETSAREFTGNTRLMLFTDERPNVGNTSAEGFMGLMENGSKHGIGLTTIGVGVQFGAELANKVSSVRGGNLFYFPDSHSMVETFTDEFATMVTELAYDMELTIHPSSGYTIAGVYGVPADMFEWSDDRSISLSIQTLFLSLRQGALYFALEPHGNDDLPGPALRKNSRVAQISLSYQSQERDELITQHFDMRLSKRKSASIGLTRGENLINEYLSLKEATKAHYEENNQEGAYQILRQLSARLRSANDDTLTDEIEFVSNLEYQLAYLSGHQGESVSQGTDDSPLYGSWVAHPEDNPKLDDSLLMRISPNRIIEHFILDESGTMTNPYASMIRSPITKQMRGRIVLTDADTFSQEIRKNTKIPDYFHYTDHSGIKSISYKIKGAKLKASIQLDDGNPPITYIFYRAAAPEPISSNTTEIELFELSCGLTFENDLCL